jgi:mannose-6-phosphate isomerase
MIVGITNTPRDYAWGSRGAISALLGWPATTAVEAELWLGAHHGSPTRILEPERAGGAADLVAWVESDPAEALGSGHERFPFLLKVLAAGSPLSLQAHPTAEQAVAGFAREEAAGIPLGAAERNYKDPYPKPEFIVAMSERFGALCGFRPVAESRAVLDRLVELATSTLPDAREGIDRLLDRLTDDGSLRSVVEWLLTRGEGAEDAVDAVSRVALAHRDAARTQAVLAETYPGDPGIVVSLLLHEVVLERGEAIFLPAGNIHAYLYGVGIELMEASDNVLRGGLTPKHIDVPELLAVLDTTPHGVPWLRPEVPVPGVRIFRPEGVGFELVEVEGDALVPLGGPAIVLGLEGSFTLAGATDEVALSRGHARYVTGESGITLRGAGLAVIATAASR